MVTSQSSESCDEEDDEPQDETITPQWQLVYSLFLWQSIYHVSNNALNALFQLLSRFFQIFRQMFATTVDFPSNILTARKLLQIKTDKSFMEFVVCPKCQSIFKYDDCIYKQFGQLEPKSCPFVAYPYHPHQSKRQPCGAKLLKKIKTRKGLKLVPIKVYPYQPLVNCLSYLASRPGFLELCEAWRTKSCTAELSDTHLSDIYDGRVWEEYKLNGFLTAPYCYLVTLNLDWFQPYSHIEYSVGVIYLAIQNLPRSERYKEENIMLVGLIPGPSEPKLTVNSYLSPLVEELQLAWFNGIKVKTCDGLEVTFRLALSCVACDIPASRKVCGFLGHNATLGCNKCYKEFSSTSFGTTDYSGFNRDTWVLRTGQLHRQNCRELSKEVTKTGLKKSQSTYGVRYSALLSLPYFDAVRYTVVDVIHNLFLGIGKHMFKVWISLDILTKDNLTIIEDSVKVFTVPNYVGRLPINISSNYGGYTASQWQSWITLYSPVVLKDLLPSDHYRCWLLFVKACSILS